MRSHSNSFVHSEQKHNESNKAELGNYLMIKTALGNGHSERLSHKRSLMTVAEGAAGSQPQFNLKLKVFQRFLMELRPICLRNFLPVTSG